MPKLVPMVPMFGDRSNKLPLSYEQRLIALARRRKQTETLPDEVNAAMAPKMVSGHYVHNGAWGALANIAAQMARGYHEGRVDSEEADLVKQRQADFEQAINEAPQEKRFDPLTSMDDEGNAMPSVVNKPTSQDLIRWGGRMSQLGPQGQAIGQAAVMRGVESMFPKTGGHDWDVVEVYDEQTGRKRKMAVSKSDPRVRMPIGGVAAEGADRPPHTLVIREQLASELANIRERAAAEGRPLTQVEKSRVGVIVTTLNQMVGIPSDGGVLMGDKTASSGMAQPPDGTAPPVPAPGAGNVPPGVREITNAGGTAIVPPGGGAPRPLTDEEKAKNLAAQPVAPQVQAQVQAEAKDVDEHADFRKGGKFYDVRNEPYLSQPVTPGTTVVRQGTGPQQRLNADVQKLAEKAQAEKIPELDSAWAEFKVAWQAARGKAKEIEAQAAEKAKAYPKGMMGSVLDMMRMGGGVAGPAGINNLIPDLFTSQEGLRLRQITERIKAIDRNALFGQTLTGNEKESFERMAGTMFGNDDQAFLNAMKNFENQYDAKKNALFGAPAPIVYHTYKRGAAKLSGGAAEKPAPWKGGF